MTTRRVPGRRDDDDAHSRSPRSNASSASCSDPMPAPRRRSPLSRPVSAPPPSVVVSVYLLGRRKGRRRASVLEIRRV